MEKITIVSEIQPPQNDKERKTRERVACFLKHPNEEKFALIEEQYGITVPWWWIEEGASLEQAVEREIKEEVWFLHIKKIKNLQITIQLERYEQKQDLNLHSISHFFFAELLDLEQQAWEFNVIWEEKEAVLSKITPQVIKVARSSFAKNLDIKHRKEFIECS